MTENKKRQTFNISKDMINRLNLLSQITKINKSVLVEEGFKLIFDKLSKEK